MPSGGHNAKPLSVLKPEGGFRADRHASRGPRGGGEPLLRPDDLGQHGDELWDHVVRCRAAWLASSDAEALRSLCDLWQLRMSLLPLLKHNPADKDLRCSFNAYHAEWSKLAARFGLTPSDRARLGENLEERNDNEELEGMLA